MTGVFIIKPAMLFLNRDLLFLILFLFDIVIVVLLSAVALAQLDYKNFFI